MRARILAIDPWCLLVVPFLVAIFTVAQLGAARLLAIPTSTVHVGVGPVVTRWGRVHLRAIPVGAALQIGPPDDDGTTYQSLSLGQKLGLQLTGPASLGLLAPVLRSVDPDLGLICLLLAAMNLAPIPSTAGGQTLLAVFERVSGSALSGTSIVAWTLTSLIFLIALVGWLFWG